VFLRQRCIPMTQVLAPAATPDPRVGTAAGVGFRVLVVDDEPAVARVLRLGLEWAGFQVSVAGNGVEALRAMRGESFDWVVTDILMPDMEGLEFIRRLRMESPQTRIIAITGGGRLPAQEILQMACRLGAVAGLEKPFGIDQLLAGLRSHPEA
jgi:CheY-like chemotaxis protein